MYYIIVGDKKQAFFLNGMICLKEKCRGSLSARDLLRMHSDAVGRSLGAAETNLAVTAAASHRPTVLLQCGA